MQQLADTIWAHPLPPGRQPGREVLELSDGYRTAVFVHEPLAGRARRGPVLQVHGIQSHPGWFGASAHVLAEAGHPVFQVTRRGSGENAADRGDAPSAAALVRDVRIACDFILRRTGSDRLHLVGISWGGKLLACCCAAAGQALPAASLTLVAPGLVPRVDVTLAQKLAIAWALLGGPRRRFDIPLSDVHLFTDNPAMQEYLRNDPLRLHQASARFLFASRMLDRQLRRAADACLAMPVTLLLAGRDRIIDNTRTRHLATRLAGGGPRVIELDAAHTMEFETDPSPFCRELASVLAAAEASG